MTKKIFRPADFETLLEDAGYIQDSFQKEPSDEHRDYVRIKAHHVDDPTAQIELQAWFPKDKK